MDMREWIQNDATYHSSVHFPLMVGSCKSQTGGGDKIKKCARAAYGQHRVKSHTGVEWKDSTAHNDAQDQAYVGSVQDVLLR